ncbi:MAG: hypothetical protein JNL10_21850 [Verrucomicrobiales bacterium]|nr:hypothetical protein [Verrucomicrobiales bacterium]
MKRILLGSLAAAIALFLFGAAFWTCPIPYAYVEKAAVGDVELGQALRNALPNDGLYLVPSITTDPKQSTELHRQGPVVTIHYRKGGVEPMTPGFFASGFLHGWVTTFLLAGLLHLTARPRFGQRLLIVTVAGLAGVNYMVLGAGIYWFQPWPWLMLNAAYDAVAFVVSGLVLAAIVKPPASVPPAGA